MVANSHRAVLLLTAFERAVEVAAHEFAKPNDHFKVEELRAQILQECRSEPAPSAVPCVAAALDELAKKNGHRPCDCTSCECGNSGDTYSVGSWDGSQWVINELRKALNLPSESERNGE